MNIFEIALIDDDHTLSTVIAFNREWVDEQLERDPEYFGII